MPPYMLLINYIFYQMSFQNLLLYGAAEQQCFLNAVVRTIAFTERKVKVKISLTSNEDSEVG